MRVLVVTPAFLLSDGPGGAALPVRSRTKRFSSTILTHVFIAEQVRCLRSANIDVEVVFFSPRKTRLSYGLLLARIARAISSRQYDLIHTHNTYTMILADVARRLTGTKVPVVLTSHEGEIVDRRGRTRTWHPSSQLRHSLRLKRFAAGLADFVIFVSRQLAEVLAIDSPHDVIPCGVDLDKFRPLDQRECRKQLGLPADRLVIFFPPNPKIMLKRFELAREVHELVRRELPDALMVTGGGIQADLMPVYYNAANVMLQTSFWEASPTIVKEALACEVPVVSTDAGDTREVLQGVPNCWVCREDPRELANRILEANGKRATGARDQLLRMGLGLEQVAQRVIRVYERVLSG